MCTAFEQSCGNGTTYCSLLYVQPRVPGAVILTLSRKRRDTWKFSKILRSGRPSGHFVVSFFGFKRTIYIGIFSEGVKGHPSSCLLMDRLLLIIFGASQQLCLLWSSGSRQNHFLMVRGCLGTKERRLAPNLCFRWYFVGGAPKPETLNPKA